MLRPRSLGAPALACLVALAAQTAHADAMRFTGDVERDFPIAPGNGVIALIDNPTPEGTSSPLDVAQSQSITDRGGMTGWNIKDLRLSYDAATDELHVGVNFFGIAGDADGDGNPGASSTPGGRDEANLGGRESITVTIDTNLDGVPNVIAGIPAVKASNRAGIDFFQISEYRNSNQGDPFSFGQALAAHTGQLAFNPDAAHPDFEFTITSFTRLQGLNPANGFAIGAFAGTSEDIIAGEDDMPLTRISFPDPRPQVPEPAAVLGWSLLAAGAAWRWRRSRRLAPTS